MTRQVHSSKTSHTDGYRYQISELLDEITARLRSEQPGLEGRPPRQRALDIVSFLRSTDLTGLTSEIQYRDLQNNYIGIALQASEHPSLPLISVAIYCAVAQRLGLEAHPCAFPSHVHAMIYFEEEQRSQTLPSTADPSLQTMYLDPYRSDKEVPVGHLRTQLTAWGVVRVQAY
jgi:F-box protein 21